MATSRRTAATEAKPKKGVVQDNSCSAFPIPQKQGSTKRRPRKRRLSDAPDSEPQSSTATFDFEVTKTGIEADEHSMIRTCQYISHLLRSSEGTGLRSLLGLMAHLRQGQRASSELIASMLLREIARLHLAGSRQVPGAEQPTRKVDKNRRPTERASLSAIDACQETASTMARMIEVLTSHRTPPIALFHDSVGPRARSNRR